MALILLFVGLLVIVGTLTVIARCKEWGEMGDTWLFLAILSGFIVAGIISVGIWWGVANGKAEMINNKYQTSYTTKEVFYHYGTIKQMIEGEKIKVQLID